MKCTCSELQELQQYKQQSEILIKGLQKDLLRISKLNSLLTHLNIQLVGENSKLKSGGDLDADS